MKVERKGKDECLKQSSSCNAESASIFDKRDGSLMQRAWQKVAARQRLFSARRTTAGFLACRPAREDLRSSGAEGAVLLPAYGFVD